MAPIDEIGRLRSAKSVSIEAWGGTVGIKSAIGKGTAVSVSLPIHHLDIRFQGLSAVKDSNRITVLDDDIQILKKYWEAEGKERVFFDSPILFMDWFESVQDSDQYTFVIDLHLGSMVSGLDVLRTLGKRPNLYLATSDYLNTEALEVAEHQGVTIIPKPLFSGISAI